MEAKDRVSAAKEKLDSINSELRRM